MLKPPPPPIETAVAAWWLTGPKSRFIHMRQQGCTLLFVGERGMTRRCWGERVSNMTLNGDFYLKPGDTGLNCCVCCHGPPCPSGASGLQPSHTPAVSCKPPPSVCMHKVVKAALRAIVIFFLSIPLPRLYCFILWRWCFLSHAAALFSC